MKSLAPAILLTVSTLTFLHGQEGEGQLFEKIFRGLAHAVTSDNGSSLIPPSVPYEPQSAPRPQPSPRMQERTREEPVPPRSWYQPPPVSPAPQAGTPPGDSYPVGPRPRVIRQPRSQEETNPSNGPFSGWYQPPRTQPVPPYHSPAHQHAPTPPPQAVPTESPFGKVTPFRKALSPSYTPPQPAPPQGHRESDHTHEPAPLPWLFGQGNPVSVSRHPSHTGGPGYRDYRDHSRYDGTSRHSHSHVSPHRDHTHDHHHEHTHHHSHERPHPQESQRIIGMRSPFQAFPTFQGRADNSVISSRSVTPAPNQGTILWFKVR